MRVSLELLIDRANVGEVGLLEISTTLSFCFKKNKSTRLQNSPLCSPNHQSYVVLFLLEAS